MAKAYRCRPSELLGITGDGLTAFHLDVAVWRFGEALDEALHDALHPPQHGRRAKPPTPAQQHLAAMTVLEKWLGLTGLRQYRDPAAGRG